MIFPFRCHTDPTINCTFIFDQQILCSNRTTTTTYHVENFFWFSISECERENKLRAYSHRKMLVIYSILIFISPTYIKLYTFDLIIK